MKKREGVILNAVKNSGRMDKLAHSKKLRNVVILSAAKNHYPQDLFPVGLTQRSSSSKEVLSESDSSLRSE